MTMQPLPFDVFDKFGAPADDRVLAYVLAYAEQEVARERALLEKIHAKLECDGHGFWLPEWCVKECSTVDGLPPTFNEFRNNIRARYAGHHP